MKYIRKNALLLATVSAVLVLITGSLFSTVVEKNFQPLSPPMAAEDRAEVIELDLHEDPGLKLYRNANTRSAVIDFYAQETASKEIAKAILTHAEANDIPLALAFSLACIESGYNPSALNRNKWSVDRGLFQLNSRSFPHLSETEFFSISTNAEYGLSYLRYCISEGESEIVGLAMYNAGPARVKESIPYATLKHVARIQEYRRELASRFVEYMRLETEIRYQPMA